MSLRTFILDAWTGLSLKSGMDETGTPGRSKDWVAPTWVGHHSRRLLAYKILDAYSKNRGREFMVTVDADERRMHREYGDVALLINVVLAAVMGDDVAVVVEGAEAEPGDAATDAEKATHAAAVARQAEIDEWAADERYATKMLETERDTQRLGDGVYVLGFNADKGRARLRLYDPGFYFPVLDPNQAEDEFPRRVDIAWQFEETLPDGKVRDRVRRMTWELRRLPDDATQSLPWNDQPTPWTCYWSDGIWNLDDLGRANEIWDVHHFPEPAGQHLTGDDGRPILNVDLGIDFIPVVHVPNTVAVKEHFGEALITSVIQLVDDLAEADTDAAQAASLAGVPMLGASGLDANTAQQLSVAPGVVLGLGPDGKLSVLDLSASLQSIMAYVAALQARLSENKRVPAEVLGRVAATSSESGIHLALSFGPLRSLVEEMRLVRAEKYSLLWKFAQRMMIAGKAWQGDVLPVKVKFGSYLPSDQAVTIEAVIKLYTAKLISRATAIAWLVNEGIIDVVVSEELEAAEAEDFAAALKLLEATDGDHQAVYDLLHLEIPDDKGVVDEPALNPSIPLPALPAQRPQSVLAATGAAANGANPTS